MGDDPSFERPPITAPPNVGAIRGSALGLLLAGAVCLYFGFSWLATAPGSASETATNTWFLVDNVFRWALRVVGCAFLAIAALAGMGTRLSMLLATLAESVFTLLMAAMATDKLLEGRADGQFDVTGILLLALMVVGISAARHSYRLYRGQYRTPSAE